MYQYCRREESKMNACVFEKLVRPAAFPVTGNLSCRKLTPSGRRIFTRAFRRDWAPAGWRRSSMASFRHGGRCGDRAADTRHICVDTANRCWSPRTEQYITLYSSLYTTTQAGSTTNNALDNRDLLGLAFVRPRPQHDQRVGWDCDSWDFLRTHADETDTWC